MPEVSPYLMTLATSCSPSGGLPCAAYWALLRSRRINCFDQLRHCRVEHEALVRAVELILRVDMVRLVELKPTRTLLGDVAERDHVDVAADLHRHVLALHPRHQLLLDVRVLW